MRTWIQQLDRATDPIEVVAIARDYFSTWTPEEVARLPRSCRPGRLRAPGDLVELHGCAVDAYRTTRESGEELKALQLLTSFLVHANLRLVQLQGDSDGPPGEDPPAPPERHSRARDT